MVVIRGQSSKHSQLARCMQPITSDNIFKATCYAAASPQLAKHPGMCTLHHNPQTSSKVHVLAIARPLGKKQVRLNWLSSQANQASIPSLLNSCTQSRPNATSNPLAPAPHHRNMQNTRAFALCITILRHLEEFTSWQLPGHSNKVGKVGCLHRPIKQAFPACSFHAHNNIRPHLETHLLRRQIIPTCKPPAHVHFASQSSDILESSRPGNCQATRTK